MSKHKELLIRVYVTVLVVILIAFVLAFRVVKVNVIEGDKWRARGDSLYVKYVPVEAERGDILGRDGRILVTSVPFFEIRMDTRANGLTDEVFQRDVDSLAYYLSRHTDNGWSQGRYRNWLIQQRNKGQRYLLIKRNVNYAELERFMTFPIFRRGQNKGGFIAVKKPKRLKRYGDLASRTLGLARENAQPVGLEGYFDKEMRGVDGKRLMQRVKNAWIPVTHEESIEPSRGADVYTTIDIDMQDIVESALHRAAAYHEPEWATAVLMESSTGAILAIANLDRAKGGGYYEGYNHAVGSRTEPGSTFKLASVMALLEDGYADLDTRVDLHNGRKEFYGQLMQDSKWHKYREVDMREAFERSSNVGIATLADEAYGHDRKGQEFIEKFHQFGLNQTTGIRIPGERAPYIKEAYNVEQSWSATSIPWMSHGYELQLTPLQTLSFYNAVANDGKMMRPHLVTAIGRNGKIERRFKPEVVKASIAKNQTIDKAKELLHGVMLRGTGKDHRSAHIEVAGKTGTTVLDYFRESGRKKYQGSFAGYFPADNPRYSLIVLLYDPMKNGFYGGQVALPAFMEIAERVSALEPVEWKPDTVSVEGEYLVSAGYSEDMNTITGELGIAFGQVVESDWIEWKRSSETSVIGAVSIENGIVPDVVGMGLRDAVYILENAGLEVDPVGVGKVRKQSIKAGTKVSNGTRVRIELK